MNRRAGRPIPVFLLFVALTIVMTYPQALLMGTAVADYGDTLFNSYVLAWDYHALTTPGVRLFDANILYPARRTLAFSEHLLANLPIAWPAMALTGNPVAAHNSVLLASFVMSGFFTYLLAWRWTGSLPASITAGILFAFSPVRFGQLSHLQILTVHWTPLALLFLDRSLAERRWADVLGFAASFALQVLSSYYVGYFLAVVVAAYLVFYLARRRFRLDRRLALQALAAAAVVAAAVLPPSWPYLEVKRQWGFDRRLYEPISGSADLVTSYLSTPENNRIYGRFSSKLASPENPWEKHLFPGVVTIALAGFALIGSRRPGKGGGRQTPGREASLTDREDEGRRLFLWLALVSFAFSLGPVLVVNGANTGKALPYLIFYDLVPGFSSMRVPARIGIMVQLALSLLAALGAARLIRTVRKPAALVLALPVLALIEFSAIPLPLARIPANHVPPVYRWLAERPEDGPLIELPTTGDLVNYAELMRQVRYTFFAGRHLRPTANGYSGFWTPTFFELAGRAARFPEPDAVAYLADAGLRTFLVHTAGLSPRRRQWLNEEVRKVPGLILRAQFGDDLVYGLPLVQSTRASAPDPPVAAEALPDSDRDPELLGVAYREVAVRVVPGLLEMDTPILKARLENTGRAVWRSRPRSFGGEVKLLYRWIGKDGRPDQSWGEIAPGADIAPGGIWETGEVVPRLPSRPGRYTLEVGLVSAYRVSLAELGYPPVCLTVELQGD